MKGRKQRNGKDQNDFLFKVIQYIERQIVLIDALEDAAYTKIHRIKGENSYSNILDRVKKDGLSNQMSEAVKEFGVRVVLTAHPTQFYPSQVLAIIKDLMEAIQKGSVGDIRDLLQQLGKTPFFQKQKPTPLDEANRLTYYLRDTLFPAIGQLFYIHVVVTVCVTDSQSLQDSYSLGGLGVSTEV